MKIVFVRHGVTNAKKKKILQGIDEPLNDEGVRQVNELASVLDEDFDAVLSSPLKRAIQTAEIICRKLKLPLEVKKELRAFDVGFLAGKTTDSIKAEIGCDASFANAAAILNYDFRPYGGESAKEFQARILKFIDDVKDNYGGKNVIAITHGDMIQILYHLFPRQKFFPIDYASAHPFFI